MAYQLENMMINIFKQYLVRYIVVNRYLRVRTRASSRKNVAAVLSNRKNLDTLLSEDFDELEAYNTNSTHVSLYFENFSSDSGCDNIDFDSVESGSQIGADGTIWKDITGIPTKQGRLERQNVLTYQPGLTAEIKTFGNSRSPLFHFSYFINTSTMNLVQKGTIIEAKAKSQNPDWNLFLPT